MISRIRKSGAKKPGLHRLLAVLLFILLTPDMAWSAVFLDGRTDLFVLGPELKILEDKTGSLTIEDLVYTKVDRDFTRSESEIPNFGHTQSTYWVRLDLYASEEARLMEWVLELGNQLVFWTDLYLVQPSDPCLNSKTCLFQPFQNRSVVHGNNVFFLTPSESQRLYLKIQSEDTMKIPLLLWSADAFTQKKDDVKFFGGIFLGVLIVMGLYNLFLFISIRDTSYLYFVFFILCYLAALDSGNKLLWQAFPWWINEIMPLSLCLIGLSLALFSRSYLRSKKHLKIFDKILLFFVVESIVMTGFSFVLETNISMVIARVFLILEYVFILLVGGLSLKKGYRASLYFMVAIVPILFGFLISGLSNFGIIPVNVFTTQIPSIGALTGIVLFSFGLGDKINLERKKKFEAQQKAVDHLKRADRLKSEMLSTVEREVEERTMELNSTLRQVEESNRIVMDSIEYAKKIQGSILPGLQKFAQYLPDSFIIWRPRDIVGGDIYFLEYIENSFFVGVMDCTGHGVPGALMTMIASSGIRRVIHDEGVATPADALKRMNSIVKTSLQQDKSYVQSDDGLDAAICLVEPNKNQMVFAGARMPLLIASENQIELIRGDRHSIGYKRARLDFDFTNHAIDLKRDHSYYLYSDGFVDQLGGKKNLPFGKSRLKEIIRSIQGITPSDQKTKLLNALESYRRANIQQDDITLVGFRLDHLINQ